MNVPRILELARHHLLEETSDDRLLNSLLRPKLVETGETMQADRHHLHHELIV